jgi:hypothetical protein
VQLHEQGAGPDAEQEPPHQQVMEQDSWTPPSVAAASGAARIRTTATAAIGRTR